MIKQGITELLATEMDRKDFLKTVAIAAVAVTGVTTILKTLSNQVAPSSTAKQSNQPLGYGMSRYSNQPSAKPTPASYSA